jgi:hypothetical protein
MALLHGLLLVFSILTVAPLLIVFSMAVPSLPDADGEPQPPIVAVPVHLYQSEELDDVEEIPVYARQLNPSPFR